MNKYNLLSEKWIKASIIGTIWAASEIVLGSFLHNMKIPFSGNVLTAIGIIIIISISYVWTEKGLIWRAGLICAIMKTMSPSAVIFGPMIAILSEAILLDISVRLLGKTILGYVLGAMLAMSWNLFQKIMNYLVFYGFNIVELYSNLIRYAQKQLDIQLDIIWLPIIILLFIYSILGAFSAIIGIKVGRKIVNQPTLIRSANDLNSTSALQNIVKQEFNYSMAWLFADMVLVVVSLFVLNYSSWITWSLLITGIVTLWAFRYKRALRQLSKPKFWISFVLITMISAFIFSKMQSGVINLEQGLFIGIQMNFRAVIIILGFSVLGTELYNPKIREFFLKTSFKQLPMALELSFDSLPSMIANIPEFRSILKNPVSILYQFISQAELRLAQIKKSRVQKVFIISGSVGQGKTSFLQKIAEDLKKRNFSVGGILSPRIMEKNVTAGYDLIDISSGKRENFLRLHNYECKEKIGKYSISTLGLTFGSTAFTSLRNVNTQIVIIDEVGVLELENRGWAENVKDLLNEKKSHLILSVRDSLIQQVLHHFNLEGCFVYKLSEVDTSTISNCIFDQVGY